MTAAGHTFFFVWEVALMEWLQAHIGSAGISFISLFSLFGEELPLILIVCFVYWSYDKKMGRSIGLRLLQCAFLAAIAMLLFRCCSPSQAMKSINWDILMVFAGSVVLGVAIQKTGIAERCLDQAAGT